MKKQQLTTKEEGKEDCDCKMFIGGSGELCPKCKNKKGGIK